MTDEAPSWLLTMRSISGMSETPGTADNPKILAMADEIARIFPEMKSYCDGYNADSIPWCGLTEAYCMAKAGIRPPFGATDTDKFLWARSWEDDPGYAVLKAPRLGCVVVLTRSGGGHVSTYESTSGSNYMLRGGNQSDAINLAAFPKSNVVALVWPKEGGAPPPIEPPSAAKPTLRKGDSGADVAYMQTLLPKWIDGDFGTTTESLVKEFQRSKALEADGICGPDTWAALMEEEPPLKPIPTPPPFEAAWIENITATVFGGAADNEHSAYPPYDLLNDTDLYLSLPDRFEGTRPMVDVRNDAGKIVSAPLRDVGPWMVDDDYFAHGLRPIAETCYKNKTPLPSGPNEGRIPSNDAGIDLSPALAKQLGVDGKGKVAFRLVRS